ncbi:MAG: ribonuclease P protein subunit [Acidilobaceae archaeon]
MRISLNNILCHELIGLEARVIRYPDSTLEGLQGRVYWETERSITLDTGARRITLLKPGLLLEIKLPSGEKALVKGDDILESPFERAKRIARGERCSASA